MSDLFGFVAPAAPFKDIRNQRPTVAEEKAILCAELNCLCRNAPKALGAASINRVREWKEARKIALKVLTKKASSRTELSSAINNMKRFG